MDKKFESVSEIIKDEYFLRFLRTNVIELTQTRLRRPAPKPGYYYKRDWYDRMSEAGQVNVGFFINNIQSVWDKKSQLSSEIRHIIKYVADKSLLETLQEYARQEKQPTIQKPFKVIKSTRSTYNRKTGQHNTSPVIYVQQTKNGPTRRVSLEEGLKLVSE